MKKFKEMTFNELIEAIKKVRLMYENGQIEFVEYSIILENIKKYLK